MLVLAKDGLHFWRIGVHIDVMLIVLQKKLVK